MPDPDPDLPRTLAPQVLGVLVRRYGDFAAAEDTPALLGGHPRLYAVRARLLELAGDRHAAVENCRAAAIRTASLPERNHLTLRAARLADGG